MKVFAGIASIIFRIFTVLGKLSLSKEIEKTLPPFHGVGPVYVAKMRRNTRILSAFLATWMLGIVYYLYHTGDSPVSYDIVDSNDMLLISYHLFILGFAVVTRLRCACVCVFTNSSSSAVGYSKRR